MTNISGWTWGYLVLDRDNSILCSDPAVVAVTTCKNPSHLTKSIGLWQFAVLATAEVDPRTVAKIRKRARVAAVWRTY